MSRNIAAWLAFLTLVALTLLTWRLGDSGASAWWLAAAAMLKVVIIGAVFLEMGRSRPLWAGLLGVGVLVVLVGSAGLITLGS